MQQFFIAFLLFLLPFSLQAASKSPHPIKTIKTWFKEEKEKSSGGFHQFATLSTVGANGHPYSRMIEIVRINQKDGLIFFTHSATQKVKHLSLHPYASLSIWLPKTLRQISINGNVKKVPQPIAEKSWRRMPRFMKLTFLSSKHEGILPSLEALEERKEKLEKTYKETIPIPDTFIGYQLMPEKVIFYTITPRRFPEKKLAEFENESWHLCQLEP